MEIFRRFLSLLVVILVVFSFAAAQTGTAPIAGASVTPPETISSADLTTQLSGVKDNSLTVANKIISGPLRIDADQRAIIPVAFKVEFRDCEFTDEVFVRKVDFAQSVILLRVKFDKGLNFQSVHVQGDLRLESIQAAQKIQIYQSQVDGDFRVSSSVAPAFEVESLTAANVILTLGTKSVPNLDFARLSAGRFSLSATQGAGAKVNKLVLNNASLKDTLVLQNLELQQVEAANLTVAKRAMFLPVTMIKQLDLTSANLGGFEWGFAGPVQLPQKLDIDSATMGSLSIVRGPAAGAAKSATEEQRERAERAARTDYGLAFLARAEYYEPAYASYESSLKSRGESDKADGVYFAMRDRRRYTEFVDAGTAWQKIVAGFNYVIGFGHKWFFGYGRAWVYPLIWCVVFVLLGGLIFRDCDCMERLEDATPARVFSPFWYSLDVFVPILSLGVAKNWRPKQEYRLLYFYSKFLSLIGLIFISAMVGALTGTLK